MKKLRRSTKRRIAAVVISLITIAALLAGVSVLSSYLTEQEYLNILEEKRKMINSHMRKGYVALSDLSSGEILKEGVNISFEGFYSSQEQTNYITEDEIGKILCIDVPKGTQLLKTMVTDEEQVLNLREVQYGEIALSSNISANDWCDVRIVYPNGENYCVLSKKQVKQLQEEENHLLLWLTEEEIQHMSSAIVDCFLYSGSQLYLSKYIAPTIQNASITTYIPSEQTIKLIRDNPNIIEIASEFLKEELRDKLKKRLSADILDNSLIVDEDSTEYSESIGYDDPVKDKYYFKHQEGGSNGDE